AKTLLNHIKKNDEQLYLFCSMIFYCAIRPGTELRLLKIKDINFFTNTITIRGENAKTEEGIVNIPPKLQRILRTMKITTYNRESKVYSRGGETVSKWNNALENLYLVAEVIRSNFQITNFDYSDCIDKIDNPGAFFYIDPPYPKDCRKSFNDYKYEFTNDQHRQLSYKVHNIKGMAMVSGYECDLLDDLYSDFYKTKFPVKKNNIRSSEVQEVIWTNYNPERKDLFNFT
ncbi:MAG: DNA adenine methylase, partial [Dysgonomonas sp.]